MMFNFFTSSLLFVGLLSAKLGSVDGLCLLSQPRSSDTQYSRLTLRDVYSPRITNPTKSTTWVVGKSVIVTWDLHNMPKKFTNSEGTLLLGMIKKGSDGEHLDLDHPLATNFDLREGEIRLTVPHVMTGNDYIVVLMGDSGNRSPAFRIENISTDI
ncbi:hypothetical protein BDZ94DRAFT_1253283 [Collybia nuda]|uniref:Uncharacterized protein n=1 Tax=Collybia nuda TaxID=64659 RepID=A0A9P5Y9G1_9AGAR|nr:hypothetical protein BDZ94DRAFT_1253283 [Collybia nuda]